MLREPEIDQILFDSAREALRQGPEGALSGIYRLRASLHFVVKHADVRQWEKLRRFYWEGSALPPGRIPTCDLSEENRATKSEGPASYNA